MTRLPLRRFYALSSAVIVIGLMAVSPATLAAQAVRGTLLGNVTDQGGLAMPGATVMATEVNTNISAATTTNESGSYTFTLRDGEYRVEAELSGFKKTVRQGVRVDVNTTVRVDLRLEVGVIEESITVAASTPLLQTDRADTGRVIEAIQIQAVPLGFNRNFQGMLVTVPGATRPFRPHSEFFNAQDSLSTNVNGQSRLANNVQLEGVDDNHKTGLLTVLIPSAEAIETVSISTSNYDAEFGRAGGAITNVTLKSGTNAFKGSAFAFGNTEATMASGYFSHLRPETKYLQAGFTLGGPVKKDRFFFFGDYQHTIDELGRTTRATIPTMAFRNGDFSGAPTIIYDPLTGNPDGTGRTPFPGNIIPATRISPIARSILANLPEPNVAGALGQINYQAPYVRDKTTKSFDVKINHQISSKDQLSARLSFQKPEIVDPPVFGMFGGGGKDFAGTGTNLTYSTGANFNRVWSNTFVMELRGGLSYYHNEALAAGAGQKTAQEMGIPGANIDEWTSGMTQLDITGFSNPVVGFAASLPWDRSERTVQFTGVFTKITGNHSIKFGADVRNNRDFLLQTQDNGGPRGRFQFRGPQTAIPTDAAAQNGFANAFASFLLDVPAGVGRDLKVVNPGTRHSAYFTFIQDKWQVSPDLTIDLGLRHEYYTPLVGLDERGSLSNYDPATNTLNVEGYSGVPDAVGVEKYFGNISPRGGLSYRFDERSVLRAGYGVSTMPFPDNTYAFNFPVKQLNQFQPPNTFATAGSMRQGFPEPVVADIPASGIIDAGTPALRTQAYFHVPPDLHEGSLHSWNIAYQREIASRWTAEVAYVGNRGHDIIATTNMNAGMVLGADNAGRPLFNTFGRTADVTTWVPVKTDYHSLQAKVDRRFSNGLLVTTSYTLGRSKNYSNGDSNGAIQTPADPERSWARRGEDRLHNFAASWVYHLPIGRSRRWLNDGLLSHVLGDWQVSGVFVAQSGTPINFEANNATLRAPGNTQRPNASGTPEVLGGIGPGNLWFDTSVFSAPAQNTWGNVQRNGLLDGPAYVNADATLAKVLMLPNNIRGEFRIDAFNVFNIPHFNNPNGTLGNASFGQITGVPDFSERLLRFGLRIMF
jgi:outer membrane receptor protein involved in Fe transport